jgi:outer membrane protein assembly factor BamA
LKSFILCLTLLCLGVACQSQEVVWHQMGEVAEIDKYVTIDSNKILAQSRDILMQWRRQGYHYCVIDTFYCHTDTCNSVFYRGDKYSIGKIAIDTSLQWIVDENRLTTKDLTGRKVDSLAFAQWSKQVVDHYGEHGYPFVQVKLQNPRFVKNSLEGLMVADKGNYYVFDSIIIDGQFKIQDRFFEQMLGVKRGQAYAHSKVVTMSSKLRQLTYLGLLESPKIRFINDKANVYLKVKKIQASRFDLLIGVVPKVVEGVRKWNVTAEALAELNNALGYGEYLFAQYKGLKPDNAEVLFKSTVPYFGNWPVGGHLDFRLYRNAKEHIDIYFDGGGQYIYDGINNIKVLYNYRSSRLISPDTTAIKLAKTLPSQLDVIYTGAGVSLELKNLDYRFNPSRGYSFELQTSLGRRTLIENFTITELAGFGNSYDTLSKSSIQAELLLKSNYYIPIKNWATIKLATSMAGKLNKEGIRSNEFLRIGGNRTLRGFDEESILADQYAFLTTEFRFIFDKNSYLALPFLDVGYTRILDNAVMRYDRVLGLGMGLNFATGAGIFNVSFAAGSNLGNPLDFSQLKVHFGYVNLF